MTTTQATAEQFLARNGIKFRVVQSERGPGEWNVTFSRKGGGRLKLEFFQPSQPSLSQVIKDMIATRPERRTAESRLYAYHPQTALLDQLKYDEDYEADCKEFARVRDFFGPALEEIHAMREGHG